MEIGAVICEACGAEAVPKALPAKAYPAAAGSQLNRARKALLVAADCVFIGLSPILVYMCKVDGQFPFNPVSINFLAELTKTVFALGMLLLHSHNRKPGERNLLSSRVFLSAASSNILLAAPAFLYAVNNYLKFTMQLYFRPATVKMLSNLKWEALFLLLVGISINQLPCGTGGDASLAALPLTGYLCTALSVTIPSAASVYNEFALKRNFETSVHLQNLFLYGYGVFFNFLFLLGFVLLKGADYRNLFSGQSATSVLLVANNAAQGILSSFFFKYADTILKKYSSTIATIFTGMMSAALFGHTLRINFLIGIAVVFISMHQFFASVTQQPRKASVYDISNLHYSSASLRGPNAKEVALIGTVAAEEEGPGLIRKDSSQELLLLPR